MARTSTVAKVGKRKIELSNLEKVLFPEDKIIKAAILEYYLKIAPTLLLHVKGRPLSFVRYPDGIHHQPFFQKNKQDWAPDWIEHIALGESDKIDYVLATEPASLVWLANLACIEIHQMHCRQPNYNTPDYIVFDLDPPEKYPFKSIVELAFELKEEIERHGYHTFVKTTGGKGVHIVCPIEPEWEFRVARDAAHQIAKLFVDKHSKTTTLHIKKDMRQNRVLIDIYRNSTYQTIISPYSLRGKAAAPVSMPLRWEELESVTDPTIFNINTVPDLVIRNGDAWEAIGAYATRLHTEKGKAGSSSSSKKERSSVNDSLDLYAAKRRFSKTPEPPPKIYTGDGKAFVLHRHHASRLHYDLRIERDGTLKSFAVPKGLPPRPGIKRMAVNTEDHPLEYTNFEGTIPKGEYGGGDMWIFARGKHEITKEKKDGFYIRLQSRELNADYRMIHTKNRDWLVERVDPPQVDWLTDPIEPMLAQIRDKPFDSPDYIYEVKWDGIRAMISLDEGKITIRSRNQRDVTENFPELLIPEQAFRATSALFDGEIVCLNEKGEPVFEHVVTRLHHRSESAIARARARHPAVCYLFDCLYLDGRPIVNDPLMRRRDWLIDSIRPNQVYRVSEAMDEGVELYTAAANLGLEGIVAKERTSPYLPGKRSPHWFKIKTRLTVDSIIVGYTKGKGERERTFGALQLARYKGDNLVYIGKVGTGFDDRLARSITADLQKLKEIKRPVKEKPLDDAQTVWLEPLMVCEVQVASARPSGGLIREPVFVRLRPDMSPDDCRD
jgi:DNA ligase D-like protein (predicted ligase)/DNA ligase D-like protein (predicted polymerase)/DNA ligase D-like protein (predicted 3'-phosphoesterase)